jgi:predicted DsbA family dithiol-disulfide isomerase
MLQARRLREEFGAQTEWRGYELMPEELPWPDRAPAAEAPANKPPILSRFDFLLYADELELPKTIRPSRMRTHNAHEAVAYAKRAGKADAFVEALYHAYWEEGREINRPDVLHELAQGVLDNPDEMLAAVNERRYASEIVGFDDPAYATGVYNVPTFFIGDARYAEHPYAALKKAVQNLA